MNILSRHRWMRRLVGGAVIVLCLLAFMAMGAKHAAADEISTTTPPFATTVNDQVLLAMVGASGPLGESTQITSQPPLAWTRAVAANGQPGAAEIWWAPVQFPTNGITVTDTRSGAAYSGFLLVKALMGVDTVSPIGNVATPPASRG